MLTGNAATGNTRGFDLYQSSYNTLSENRTDTNSGCGYEDITQGTGGTSGTANTYTRNECSGNRLSG